MKRNWAPYALIGAVIVAAALLTAFFQADSYLLKFLAMVALLLDIAAGIFTLARLLKRDTREPAAPQGAATAPRAGGAAKGGRAAAYVPQVTDNMQLPPALAHESGPYREGCRLYGQNRYPESRREFEKAEKEAHTHTELSATSFHRDLARIYCILGMLSWILNSSAGAKTCFEYSMDHYRTAGDERSNETAKLHYHISKVYARDCDFKRAAEELLLAKSIYEENKTGKRERAYVYFDLGEIYLTRYSLSKAKTNYDHAMDHLKPLTEKDKPFDALIRYRWAHTQLLQGNESQAGREFLDLENRLPWGYENGMGEIELCRCRYEKAEEYFSRVAGLCRADRELPSVYLNLAYTYDKLERYREALDYAEQAFRKSLECYGAEHPKTAEAQSFVAKGLIRLGKEAGGEVRAAKQVLDRYGNSPGKIQTLINRGMRSREDPEKAMAHFQRACDLLKSLMGENSVWMAHAYDEISRFFSGAEEYGKAAAYLKQASDILYKKEALQGPHMWLHNVCKRLGALYGAAGAHDMAARYYEYALDRLDSGDDRALFADLYLKIGDSYLLVGSTDDKVLEESCSKGYHAYRMALEKGFFNEENLLHVAEQFYNLYYWGYALEWYRAWEKVTGREHGAVFDIYYRRGRIIHLNGEKEYTEEECIRVQENLQKARARDKKGRWSQEIDEAMESAERARQRARRRLEEEKARARRLAEEEREARERGW